MASKIFGTEYLNVGLMERIPAKERVDKILSLLLLRIPGKVLAHCLSVSNGLLSIIKHVSNHPGT